MNQNDKAYKEWLALCDRISKSTAINTTETPKEQQARIKRLLSSFEDFCYYYFPAFTESKFGWFHLRAAKAIINDPKIFAVLEWPREHAKSIFADVLIPMFLKARGELTGMMVASANEKKAQKLLGDIQAELLSNQRFIHDFGKQSGFGSWSDGFFQTNDNIGFWAFGRDQSARGSRVGENRPNYGVIDDIDDATVVRNEQRVDEYVNWIKEDFMNCMPLAGSRLVIAGNRIHKKSILAKIVEDIEPGDPVNPFIYHLKVFAIETKTHKRAEIHNGQPAWKERYTLEHFEDRFNKIGYRSTCREYFHEHVEQGIVFKPEDIIWAKCPPLKAMEQLVSYCDPSFKDTKKNDYKGVVLVGRIATNYYIIRAFVRQATTSAMVQAHYDMHEHCKGYAVRHYMEANFLQDILLDEYDTEGTARGYSLSIRPDREKKPDKYSRIENLQPLFERKKIVFNEDCRTDTDMNTLKEQLLSFPYGHDDGPDALEGALSKMASKARSGKIIPRFGNYARNPNR